MTKDSQALTTREPAASSSNIVALAIQNPDGTVTVTDVLCNNFPTLSRDKIAALSWKLCEFGKANG